MSCPECVTATERPYHGFAQGCIGCCARAVARSPQFAKARREGRQDRAYRALLAQFNLTHDRVLEQFKTDAIGRVAA